MTATDPLPEVLRARPWAMPLLGTVKSVTTGTTGKTTTAVITIYGVDNVIPVAGGYAPTVGDVALVLVADRRLYAIGYMSRGGAPPVIPAPPALPSSGVLTVPATAAGTYQAGALRTDRTDVLQGTDNGGPNQGAFAYGTTLAGTLAGLTVGTGWVWIDRRPTGPAAAGPLWLYLHAAPALPAGTPAIVDRYTLPAVALTAAWYALPASWVAQLAAGTASGLGIGGADITPAPPLMALASLAQSDQSGTIQINWSR